MSLAWVAGQLALVVAVALPPLMLRLPLGIPGEIVSWVLVALGALVMGVAALNLGDALTPFPLPNRFATLSRGGLYRFVRHPIYTGLLVFCAGVAVGREGLLNLLALVALYAFLHAKSGYEERLLARRYPDYADYARATPRFFPWGRRR